MSTDDLQIKGLHEAAANGIETSYQGETIFLSPYHDTLKKSLYFSMHFVDPWSMRRDSVVIDSLPIEKYPKRSVKLSYVALSEHESWYSRGEGIYHQKGDSIQFFHRDFGLPSVFINDMVLDRDSIVWIATDRGLCYQQGVKTRIF